MTFLQPGFVYALPLAALPVLIHLLNRLRYRTVRWAATMFLVSATRASTRRSRLRHILILVLRTLALLLLVAAMSRPLVGGWLGTAAAGSPDTILVLLDRSASMETTDARSRASRRERALKLVSQGGRLAGSSARFVLLDSVTRMPRELASLDGVAAVAATSPSDTAADIPALLEAAAEYAKRNRTGRMEVWLASDLQASNWRADSRDWTRIDARLAGLPQPVALRVLALREPAQPNVSVALRDIRCAAGADRNSIALSMRFQRPEGEAVLLPVTITLNGARTQARVAMTGRELMWTRSVDPGAEWAAGGWGKVEIPADGNAQDNACYFVYGSGAARPSIVVGSDPGSARYLLHAAAAGGAAVPGGALVPAAAAAANWKDAAAAQWQGELPPSGVVTAVTCFVEQGGALMCYPPAGEGPGWFGLRWGVADEAPSGDPFRVGVWDENEGLLSRTDNGENLAVASLGMTRRRRMTTAPQDSAAWHTVASFSDGAPFLIERRVGMGRVYACATLPVPEWSTLGDGLVLVPMTHRLMARGMKSRGDAIEAECGAWRPAPTDGPCVSMEGQTGRDPARDAGVYRCGSRRVALNRPAIEDDPEVLDSGRIPALLPSVKVRVYEEAAGKGEGEGSQSEIWPLCLVLAILCLMAESVLLPRPAVPRGAAARAEGAAS